MVEVKINQLKQILLELAKIQNPPSILILGEPGIGKSQVIRQVGKEVGRKVIDVRLAQIEPADIGGIPKLKRKSWEYLHNKILLEATSKEIILFFDEFNQASQQVLSAMFRIILDRSLSDGTPLHPRTMIIAAGNDSSDDNFISEIPFALLNRFFVFKLLFDENEFLEYARNQFSQGIFNFLNENRKFIYSRELNLTPRRWEQVDRMLKEDVNTDIILSVLPIQVSKGLSTYIKNIPKINIEEIINNPEKILDLPPSEIEIILKKILKSQIPKEKIINVIKKVPKPLRLKIFNDTFPENYEFTPEEGKLWVDILMGEEEGTSNGEKYGEE